MAIRLEARRKNTAVRAVRRSRRSQVWCILRQRHDTGTTAYWDSTYNGDIINHASCGFKPHKDAKRAKRPEWEHVVPAEAFGQDFKEWREGHPECVDSNR